MGNEQACLEMECKLADWLVTERGRAADRCNVGFTECKV